MAISTLQSEYCSQVLGLLEGWSTNHQPMVHWHAVHLYDLLVQVI